MHFEHNVGEFLTQFMINLNGGFDETEFKNRFFSVLEFVKREFPHGFAKSAGSKITPRVRFEAISVGVYLALQVSPDLENVDTDWLNDATFLKLTRADGSNSRARLAARIEYVRDQLLKR